MAIAFGASGTSGGAAASQTVSLTVSGSDTIIWAGGFFDSGTTLSSVTFNGLALTQVTGSPFTVDAGNSIYLAYRINPSAGTHNLVATFGASGNTTLHGAYYTGAKQSGVPDATNTSSIGSTSTPSQSVTTVANNSFAVWMLRKASSAALTAGANTTLVTDYALFGSHFLDNEANGPITPAGSFTENASFSGPAACYGIIASFAPSTVSNSEFLSFF